MNLIKIILLLLTINFNLLAQPSTAKCTGSNINFKVEATLFATNQHRINDANLECTNLFFRTVEEKIIERMYDYVISTNEYKLNSLNIEFLNQMKKCMFGRIEKQTILHFNMKSEAPWISHYPDNDRYKEISLGINDYILQTLTKNECSLELTAIPIAWATIEPISFYLIFEDLKK